MEHETDQAGNAMIREDRELVAEPARTQWGHGVTGLTHQGKQRLMTDEELDKVLDVAGS